jgi:hypothetical protein
MEDDFASSSGRGDQSGGDQLPGDGSPGDGAAVVVFQLPADGVGAGVQAGLGEFLPDLDDQVDGLGRGRVRSGLPAPGAGLEGGPALDPVAGRGVRARPPRAGDGRRRVRRCQDIARATPDSARASVRPVSARGSGRAGQTGSYRDRARGDRELNPRPASSPGPRHAPGSLGRCRTCAGPLRRLRQRPRISAGPRR